MRPQFFHSRWLIAPALLLTFCSRGDSPTLTAPTRVPVVSVEDGGGAVGSAAAGDVKVGNGALEIVRLRMDRQTSSGQSILRQYANPGGTYAINAGETIELWAEWNFTETPPNPRFKVSWGDGSEPDITGCGSCLLKHRYATQGVFTVSASLDDRVSTTATRTFTLDSRELVTAPACAITPGSLTTLFANNNGGNVGGALYFDLAPSSDVVITRVDVNTDMAVSSSITIDVYTRSGTFAGNEASMAGWTLRTSGTGVAAGEDVPSQITLNQPLPLSPGTTGIAIVATNFNHIYTNGTGGNQNYNDGNLAFAAGSATNVPFTGGVFNPRVPNMVFHYRCP